MRATRIAERLVPRPHVVRDIWHEVGDTWSMSLEPQHGVPADLGKPGQFNMLFYFGLGEVPISSSGPTEGSGPIIHTIRSVGQITRALCEMERGTVIGVRGPFGRPWPVEEARGKDLVMISRGTGLAPLRPLIYHVLAHRGDYGRIAILYNVSRPKRLMFRGELERWSSRFDLHVGVSVDVSHRDWYGTVGSVTALVPQVPFPLDDAFGFVCGPDMMMTYAVNALRDDGMKPENLYVSLERNMKCGVGLCGHCMLGPEFVCRTGPVYSFDQVEDLMAVTEM